MTTAPKTVLCIHDLAAFGRAGLAVVVPVLSAMGIQAVALPTSVLSTHTGGLGAPAKLSNPGYGPAALAQYARLGLHFDCIYAGYLGDAHNAKLAAEAFSLWPDALAVVDPVLGDNGRLYRGISGDLVPALYDLCCKADLILPNPTEAALLLGEVQLNTPTPESAAAQAAMLTRLCPEVLVTGVPTGRSIACVGAVRGGEGYEIRTNFIPKLYHGTGDIFGAVLVGRLLQGNVTDAAAQAAAAFVVDCLRATPPGADERLGVWLEAALPRLLANQTEK